VAGVAPGGAALVIPREGLAELLAELIRAGYHVVGPSLSGRSIEYQPIARAEDLPSGWTAEQEAGRYRLRRREDQALFGYSVGQRSFKERLFLASEPLTQASLVDGVLSFEETEVEAEPVAFFGVRPCELAAIAIQDRIFTGGPYLDTRYAARRSAALIVVVNCVAPGGTCFCASMGTGPRAVSGFDLALTELLDGQHRLVVELGSERGRQIMAEVSHEPARPEDLQAVAEQCQSAAQHMGRTMDTHESRALLYSNLEHPRWEDVAARCLACTNCTLVCPTCFCADVEDTTELDARRAGRTRRWASCFTLAHSYVHGGRVRATRLARYRQWLTHKVASWIDQFGMSGCVGCGRCITWCPVGIDLTEEIAAIRAKPARPRRTAAPQP